MARGTKKYTVVRCDHCGKTETVESLNTLEREGWLMLSVNTAAGEVKVVSNDICPTCADNFPLIEVMKVRG